MSLSPNTSYDEKIIHDYEFKSINQIAKSINKSYTFVRGRLVANEIELRKPGGHSDFHQQLDQDKINRAVFLNDRMGMSMRQAAVYERTSRTTINHRLRIGGAKIRPVGNKHGSSMPKDQFQKMLENRA